MRTVFLSLMAAAFALPCGAAETFEVHQAYMAKTKDLAGFLSLQKMCALAGYTVDPDTLQKTVNPVLDKAIADGMPEQRALGLMQAAVEIAVADEKAVIAGWTDTIGIASESGNEAGMSDAVSGLFGYIDGRCRTFAQSPEYGVYVKAPADPDNTAGYQSFMTWLTGTLNASPAA